MKLICAIQLIDIVVMAFHNRNLKCTFERKSSGVRRRNRRAYLTKQMKFALNAHRYNFVSHIHRATFVVILVDGSKNKNKLNFFYFNIKKNLHEINCRSS